MDLAVESPASLSRAVSPASAYFTDFPKGGGIECFHLSQSLRCRQTHFFPLPWSFARSFSRGHRADHSPISLSDEMLGTKAWQCSKGLLILLIKLFTGSLRMLQRRFPHGAGTDLKS